MLNVYNTRMYYTAQVLINYIVPKNIHFHIYIVGIYTNYISTLYYTIYWGANMHILRSSFI